MEFALLADVSQIDKSEVETKHVSPPAFNLENDFRTELPGWQNALPQRIEGFRTSKFVSVFGSDQRIHSGLGTVSSFG